MLKVFDWIVGLFLYSAAFVVGLVIVGSFCLLVLSMSWGALVGGLIGGVVGMGILYALEQAFDATITPIARSLANRRED